MNYATYCPEDDKLRLYVGRVSRDEYEALRDEGWTSTPKQDCDFVATWTPQREATALSYCDSGEIEDEDQSPEDRAADRAERFGGYRDKRLGEAVGLADRYDSGPSAHGYQSQAKGERMAARHDRIGGKAVSQWDKAEYWQQRTAGVISHALHVSSPAVRMGRIKTLEAELRKAEKSWSEHAESEQSRFDSMLSVVENAEGTREKPKAPTSLADFRWELSRIRESENVAEGEPSNPEQVRRAVIISALTSGYGNPEAWKALATEASKATRPAADIARDWLAGRERPEDWNPETGTRYTRHLRMRIAYENQMLEAQGGRAGDLEMQIGGRLGGKLIVKVNKSSTSGRVTSVSVKGPKVTGWTYRAQNLPGTEFALHQFPTERLAPGAYTPPDAESLAELEELKQAQKTGKPVKDACPLINPTKEDAERLQSIWNEEGREKYNEGKRNGRYYGEFEPAKVVYIKQETYSEASKGAYARAETLGLAAGGVLASRFPKSTGKDVCKLRTTYGGSGPYTPKSIIVLTDKPGKPFPDSVWETKAQEALA
jgi:hypothetical protein